MYDIREIQFSAEPDFMGYYAFSSPIGFFLHPKFAQGSESEFLITIDWKTVLRNEVSGAQMTDAHFNELLAKLSV